MPPPHLHPRSRMTTSLFTTTLMVSFLVVAAPHLIPCPVDPRTLADAPDPAGPNRRRRRIKTDEDEPCDHLASEERRKRLLLENKLSPKRECPVPKPGGLIGQVLGLKEGTGHVETKSVKTQVEQAQREAQSNNHDQ